MSKALIMVLIAEFWMIVGQICFKKGADRLNTEDTAGKPWIAQLLGCLLRFPSLWLGAAAMLTGLFFWLAALSCGELSYVYLLGSVQYIFALFAAYYFLQEKIDTPKLIGTLLITLGIILTAVS
jgi:uncharacterized membrane protein